MDLLCGLLPGYQNNIFASALKTTNHFHLPWTIFQPSYFSQKIAHHGFELVHTPYLLLPRKIENRINVITIHDLISFDEPQKFRTRIKNSTLLSAVERADGIIFISHETRRIFLERFGSVNRKIATQVIYNGICDQFSHSGESPVSQELEGFSHPYILWVGARAGYKNFLPFLENFVNSKSKREISIVIVGGPELNKAEKRLLAETRWKWLGNVPDPSLAYIYSNAVALVYPSSREGFGLPILEAMSCKCPVICFNSGAMGEISSGNAIYLEELSANEIDRTISVACSSQRPDIVRDALLHSKLFNWKRTAELTLEFYFSLV